MAELNHLPPRKRKHVTSACDECRRRRVRCNGDQPCASCLKSGLTCTYAVSLANPDLRFNRVTAEQYHELSTHQTVLLNLIASIRHGQAEGVLSEIRAGASISEINASLLRQQDSRKGRPNARRNAASEEHASASTTPPTSREDSTDQTSNATPSEEPDRTDWHPSLQARWDRNELVLGRESEFISSDPPYTASLVQWESTLQPTFSRPFSFRSHPHRSEASDDRIRKSAPGARKRPVAVSTQRHARQTDNVASLGNLPLSSAIVANHYPSPIQHRQYLNFAIPEYLLMPLLDTDNSPLGKLYVDFQYTGRKIILETGQPELILGGLVPEAEHLFQSPAYLTGPITTYKWAYDINKSFEGIFSTATRLASAILGGRLMRWLIYPSAETYSSVPEIIRPTISQRMVPHPGQLDLFLFPGLRDSMLTQTGDFVGAIIESGMKISWPYSLNEAFVFDPRTGRLQISPVFVAYATDTSKWKVGKRFLARFPHLKHVVCQNVSDEMVIKPVDRFL